MWILGQTTEHCYTLPNAYSIIHFVSVEPAKNTVRLFVDLGRIENSTHSYYCVLSHISGVDYS